MTTNFHAARVERLEGERAGLLAERARLTEERDSLKTALEEAKRQAALISIAPCADCRDLYPQWSIYSTTQCPDCELKSTQADLALKDSVLHATEAAYQLALAEANARTDQIDRVRMLLESELAALKAQMERMKSQ